MNKIRQIFGRIVSFAERNEDIMTKTFIPLITAFIPLIAVFVGVWQFNAQQSNNAKDAFDRKMFEKTLESYSEVSKIVGSITTLNLPRDSTTFDSLQTAFNERYWGSLLLIQQDNVRNALKGVKAEINDVRHGKGEISYIILRQEKLAEEFRHALNTYRDPK